MKIEYKGFEIEAYREQSLADHSLLYYTIYRIEDGWCLEDSSEDIDETIKEKIKQLKRVVDNYLENPEDYNID